MPEIAIVGAGIIGLYTALVLSRESLGPKITVYAQHLPGDLSIDYTSPTAGANWSSSISGDDADALEYDRRSYAELAALFRDYGARAGLERLPATELFGQPLGAAKLASLKSFLPNLEVIDDEQFLRERGAVFGIRYLSYNFNSPVFLRFLQTHLTSLGVTFVRRHLDHIKAAFASDTKVVFNCTGGLAARLGGVRDRHSYPIRGQVVLVRAPHIRENRSLFVEGQPPTYIIPRPHSGGRVILGGYYEEGSTVADTYAHQTASILDRTARVFPELLAHGPLEILDERAGLRPGHKGGARIEKEIFDGKLVIHNYGAAGTGYQAGLAMALKAVALWQPTLAPKL